MQSMKSWRISVALKCPLLKKPCIGADCMWWMQLRGKHPQTAQPVDEYDCAVKWLVVTNIETTQNIIGVQAATESFRNEMVRQQDELIEVAGQRKLQ